jgi:hypothetical protein
MKSRSENNNYDLIMIVTHRDIECVHELLLSIESCEGLINVLVIIISQVKDFSYLPRKNVFNIKIIVQSPMGLSKARNIGLNYLSSVGYSSKYIMFPDDDTTFDKFFFLNFKKATLSNSCFITPIYNEGSKDFYIGSSSKHNFQMKISDLSLVGSPNQILLYDKLKNYLYFDENLGLGAKYGSSEDMDLFVRLIKKGEVFIYTNKLYTFHPKKVSNYYGKSFKDVISRFRNYSFGYAFLISKHNLNFLIPNYLFRTLAASLYFLFKLKFKLSLAYLYQLFIRIHFIVFFIVNRKFKCLK